MSDLFQLEIERVEGGGFILRKEVASLHDLVSVLSHEEVNEVVRIWLQWWLDKRHKTALDKESA